MVWKVACANDKKVSKNIKNETNIHPKFYEETIQKACSKNNENEMEKGSKRISTII